MQGKYTTNLIYDKHTNGRLAWLALTECQTEIQMSKPEQANDPAGNFLRGDGGTSDLYRSHL